MANKPNIRFKGFTDDWEQRKLGEVFKEYSEKNHTELPALTIIQGGGTVLRDKSDRALQYDKSNLSTYKMVKKDDFIVHLRSFEGGLEKANSSGIISPAYHTFHGENTDCRFFYPFFRSRQFIDVLLKPHVYGIRDGKSIDIEGMKSILLPLPTYDEQRRIGNYIENLDHLITLHQRKCDETKKLKKFMLQKMFPKNGEKNPEIRFAGFTDDWEQRKLGDSLLLLKDGTHGTHADANEGPLLLSAKNIKDGTIKWDDTDRRISLEEYEKIHSKFNLKSGDVLLTIVGSIGETAILQDSESLTFQRSVAFLRPQNDITSEFLYSEIQSEHFQKELESRKSTSAQPGIYLGDLAEIPLYFPSVIDEQKKIGQYFSTLDHLITLHQRKCDNLKFVKKFMLQNMFPQKG